MEDCRDTNSPFSKCSCKSCPRPVSGENFLVTRFPPESPLSCLALLSSVDGVDLSEIFCGFGIAITSTDLVRYLLAVFRFYSCWLLTDNNNNTPSQPSPATGTSRRRSGRTATPRVADVVFIVAYAARLLRRIAGESHSIAAFAVSLGLHLDLLLCVGRHHPAVAVECLCCHAVLLTSCVAGLDLSGDQIESSGGGANTVVGDPYETVKNRYVRALLWSHEPQILSRLLHALHMTPAAVAAALDKSWADRDVIFPCAAASELVAATGRISQIAQEAALRSLATLVTLFADVLPEVLLGLSGSRPLFASLCEQFCSAGVPEYRQSYPDTQAPALAGLILCNLLTPSFHGTIKALIPLVPSEVVRLMYTSFGRSDPDKFAASVAHWSRIPVATLTAAQADDVEAPATEMEAMQWQTLHDLFTAQNATAPSVNDLTIDSISVRCTVEFFQSKCGTMTWFGAICQALTSIFDTDTAPHLQVARFEEEFDHNFIVPMEVILPSVDTIVLTVHAVARCLTYLFYQLSLFAEGRAVIEQSHEEVSMLLNAWFLGESTPAFMLNGSVGYLCPLAVQPSVHNIVSINSAKHVFAMMHNLKKCSSNTKMSESRSALFEELLPVLQRIQESLPDGDEGILGICNELKQWANNELNAKLRKDSFNMNPNYSAMNAFFGALVLLSTSAKTGAVSAGDAASLQRASIATALLGNIAEVTIRSRHYLISIAFSLVALRLCPTLGKNLRRLRRALAGLRVEC